MRRLPIVMVTAVVAMAALAVPAAGRIKLATLPVRERVEIQLENPKATLVEEERVVLDVARDEFQYAHRPPVVVGWDETRTWQEEVRNYRAGPIKIEIRHVLAGDVEFSAEAVEGLKLYDYRTPEYTMTIPSRKPTKWVTEGTFHLGKNQKQNRVRLVGN